MLDFYFSNEKVLSSKESNILGDHMWGMKLQTKPGKDT